MKLLPRANVRNLTSNGKGEWVALTFASVGNIIVPKKIYYVNQNSYQQNLFCVVLGLVSVERLFVIDSLDAKSELHFGQTKGILTWSWMFGLLWFILALFFKSKCNLYMIFVAFSFQ